MSTNCGQKNTIKKYIIPNKHLLILEHTYVYARAGTVKTSEVFERDSSLTGVLVETWSSVSRKREHEATANGPKQDTGGETGGWPTSASGQEGGHRETLMPRRDSGGRGWRERKTDSRGGDRRVTVSRSFRAWDVISRSVVVRPSVPGDASRQSAHRVAPARRTCTHTVYAIVPARSFPPITISRIRNRTFSRFLRWDITRSLLGRDGISKWHALRDV